MMTFIFVMLFLAILFAWIGKRKAAQYCFTIMLLFAAFSFYHDITSKLTLNL